LVQFNYYFKKIKTSNYTGPYKNSQISLKKPLGIGKRPLITAANAVLYNCLCRKGEKGSNKKECFI
jgi:hypothetical protein